MLSLDEAVLAESQEWTSHKILLWINHSVSVKSLPDITVKAYPSLPDAKWEASNIFSSFVLPSFSKMLDRLLELVLN